IFEDQLTGQRIPGVLVNITWNPSYEGYTDVNGTFKFTFNATTPGDYILNVHIEKDGFTILDEIITIHVTSPPSPPGFDMWIIYVILICVGALVAVVVVRSRAKKKVVPITPPKVVKPKGFPSLGDLYKVKYMAIMHRPSQNFLLSQVIQPEKVRKEEKQDFLELLPSLKESTLENRMVVQKELQILYHDGGLSRVSYLVDDKPSDAFMKGNIIFTNEFEKSFEPQLKTLPEDLNVFQGPIAVELQHDILNFQLLQPHQITEERPLLRLLSGSQKKIVKKAIGLAKKTATFQLFNLVEASVKTFKQPPEIIIDDVEDLLRLSIFIPREALGEAEKKELERDKKEIEKRIQKDRELTLKTQIKDAIVEAKNLMDGKKYVDAAVNYEIAAQAAKELGDKKGHKQYVAKAEECLAYRLQLIDKIETKEAAVEPLVLPEEEAEGKPAEEVPDAVLREKLNQMIEECEISYLNIIDVAQKLGISVQKVSELAKETEYKVSASRIYKKEEDKKGKGLEDLFKEILKELMEETDEEFLRVEEMARALGISEEETIKLAEDQGYQVKESKIYKEKKEEAKKEEGPGDILQEKLKVLMEETDKKALKVEEVAKVLGISEEETMMLAGDQGYQVKKSKIYKKKKE
ncbi:MAG: carboxypeptidase regulatory-like domain-containing protein, partial [Candidatus Helarchaeota archaeon]|nr:carboxypeptidase regulatory-like domain-containing protein [Candidatus Helarchaeota archaeon]